MKKSVLSRTYRLTWKVILKSQLVLIYIIPGTFLIFIMFMTFISISQNVRGFTSFLLVPVIFFLGVSFLFLCLGVIYFLIQPFFSYIYISPSGIEFRTGFAYGLRCQWDDIETLGEYKGLSKKPFDVLYIKQFQPLKWMIAMWYSKFLLQKLGLSTKTCGSCSEQVK